MTATSKKVNKMCAIANYVATHENITRHDIRMYMLSKNISMPYTSNLLSEARNLGIIEPENSLTRMKEDSVIVPGPRIQAYLDIYSENFNRPRVRTVYGETMKNHLQKMNAEELTALVEAANEVLAIKEGALTWAELGVMIANMPSEERQRNVCIWRHKTPWNDRCMLCTTKEDVYAREFFKDAVPHSYTEDNLEGCRLVAQGGTYYLKFGEE